MLKLPRQEYDIYTVIDRAIGQQELSEYNIEEVIRYIRFGVEKYVEKKSAKRQE